MAKKKLTLTEKYRQSLLMLRESYMQTDSLARYVYLQLKRAYESDDEDVMEDLENLEKDLIKKGIEKDVRKKVEEDIHKIYQ